MVRVGINGLGRIGRVFFRMAQGCADIEVAAINDLAKPEMLAYLLKYDSVHGNRPLCFYGGADHDDASITTGEGRIPVYNKKSPEEIPWAESGVDIVLESTGKFRSFEKASKHLDAGADYVMISMPASGDLTNVQTVVRGVNEDKLDLDRYKIFSNASCTTNCLAPLLYILEKEFGVIMGSMLTVHSYTNDQRLCDMPHDDFYRARAAGLSIIPTSTGAAKAIGIVMPNLEGKLDGSCVRVPTPNVSYLELTVLLGRNESNPIDISAEQINNALKNASKTYMKRILDCTEDPIVSVDVKGRPESAIAALPLTKVSAGKMVSIKAWYDNEAGYSARLVEFMREVDQKKYKADRDAVRDDLFFYDGRDCDSGFSRTMGDLMKTIREMDGQDGISIELRANEPIIHISAMDYTVCRCKDSGATPEYYFTKPSGKQLRLEGEEGALHRKNIDLLNRKISHALNPPDDD